MDLKAAQGDGQIELFQVAESGGHSAAPLGGARDLFDELDRNWEKGHAQGVGFDLFQEDPESEADGEAPPLPKTIMLLPAGKVVKARDGRAFEVDRDAVIAKANGNGADLFIDFDHAIFGFWLGGDGTGRTAPAGAWLDHKSIRKKGSGKHAAIVGDVIFWTPLGRSSVQNREYRYISPAVVFQRDDDGALELGDSKKPIVIEIVNAALVNLPALKMPALASRQNDADDKSTQETKTMNQEMIALALGLPKDATEAQITEKFHAQKQDRDADKKAIAEAKTREDDLFAKLETATTKATEQAEEFKKERTKLNAELVDARLENLSVRKIVTPAQLADLKANGVELCELGPKGAAIFEKQLAKLEKNGKPVVAPSGLDDKDAPADDSLKCRGLSRADVQKSVDDIPDMTVEKYLKHNPDLKPLFENQGAA